MQYPLEEKIGNPNLFVGREKEFTEFEKWLNFIPKKLSKSRVILARRKSGKTAFIQRIFNKLWYQNGAVIPFYFDIAESKVWYPNFAIDYFSAFASQYISFLERDSTLVKRVLPLEDIRNYAITNGIKVLASDAEQMLKLKKKGWYDILWKLSYSAPHRFADIYNQRILVILDEFQNITQYIYRDEQCAGKPDETMAGSFHSLSESKIAPMLVTGSYVGWLINVIDKYLEAGRLKHIRMSPYLTPEEGLQAVYKYADFYQEPITTQTATQINQLCMADPFFISCVVLSNYKNKDLSTEQGVINTVNYEITDRDSEMSKTWNEYLQLTLPRINDRYGKQMFLYLSKHADREWSVKELKAELNLPLSLREIQEKLILMSEADVIRRGNADIDFIGLQDGTLNLVIRNRFEKELTDIAPNYPQEFAEQLATLKKKNKRLQGLLSHISGQFAEYQLATEFRSRKRFRLSALFNGVTDDIELNIVDVRTRYFVQRPDGKNMEIDVIAKSKGDRTVVVDVKKQQAKVGLKAVEDFYDKVSIYRQQFSDETISAAFLALGGFTANAVEFCTKHKIAMAEKITWTLD